MVNAYNITKVLDELYNREIDYNPFQNNANLLPAAVTPQCRILLGWTGYTLELKRLKMSYTNIYIMTENYGFLFYQMNNK